MNVDLTTRILQLSTENAKLREANQELAARFQRLSPQAQRAAVNYEALLMMFMHFRGLDEIEITAREIEAMPRDLCLVFDGGRDGKSIHVRLMPAPRGDSEVNPQLVN